MSVAIHHKVFQIPARLLTLQHNLGAYPRQVVYLYIGLNHSKPFWLHCANRFDRFKWPPSHTNWWKWMRSKCKRDRAKWTESMRHYIVLYKELLRCERNVLDDTRCLAARTSETFNLTYGASKRTSAVFNIYRKQSHAFERKAGRRANWMP